MRKPKPSEASVKAYREWSDAIDDLNSVEGRIKGSRFIHGLDPTPELLASKASLEARIKELDPIVERDFPL